MSLPFGLHELENVGSLQETLIIAVMEAIVEGMSGYIL